MARNQSPWATSVFAADHGLKSLRCNSSSLQLPGDEETEGPEQGARGTKCQSAEEGEVWEGVP